MKIPQIKPDWNHAIAGIRKSSKPVTAVSELLAALERLTAESNFLSHEKTPAIRQAEAVIAKYKGENTK